MTTYTLEELFQKPSAGDVEKSILHNSQLSGLPVNSWAKRSVFVGTVKAVSPAIADVCEFVPKLAKSGYTSTAADAGEGFLDLLAWDFFNRIERKPAQTCVRTVTVTNNSGSTFAPEANDVWIRIPETDLLFFNQATFSVPDGATIVAPFVAEKPGVAHNASASSFEIVSGASGVTFDAYAISINGEEEETNESLIARCESQWGGLSKGASGWYESDALDFHTSIKKVKVFEGTPSAGKVTVYIANASGPSDSGVAANLEDRWDPKPYHGGLAGWNDATYVYDCIVQTVAISGVVHVKKAEAEAAKAAFIREILRYQSELQINDTIRVSHIEGLIQGTMTRTKQNYVVLSEPSNDVILASNAIVKFVTTGLVWLAS